MTTDPTDLLLVTPDQPEDHDHADDDFTHLGLAADTHMMSRSVLDRRRLLGLGALGVSTLLGAATLGGRASAALLGGGGAPPPPPPGGTPPHAARACSDPSAPAAAPAGTSARTERTCPSRTAGAPLPSAPSTPWPPFPCRPRPDACRRSRSIQCAVECTGTKGSVVSVHPASRARGMSTTERLERPGSPGWIRAVYRGSVHHTVEASKAAL